MPRRSGVSVVSDGAGWRVTLDGRALKTPGGQALVLPTEKLAAAIAEEWRAQQERIDLHSMLLTRLAYGAIDRTEEAWGAAADEADGFPFARHGLDHERKAESQSQESAECKWTLFE